MKNAKSYSTGRCDNLILKTFVLWYGGVSARLTQSRLLQAYTERRKCVLSYAYLGREVINGAHYYSDEPV